MLFAPCESRKRYASVKLPDEKLLTGPVQRIALRYSANLQQKPTQADVSEADLSFKYEWVFILQTLETGSNMCFVYQKFQWLSNLSFIATGSCFCYLGYMAVAVTLKYGLASGKAS